MPLASGGTVELDPAAARHAQVLRLQPGDPLRLFNGLGTAKAEAEAEGDYLAVVLAMGRSSVSVSVGAFAPTQCEAAVAVHIALGMPANDRMDWLVEKATELGVTSISPLMTERSVLRLSGERADKKLAHWRAVAQAACEQCGRSRVPVIHPLSSFNAYVQAAAQESKAANSTRLLLSLQPDSQTLTGRLGTHTVLSLLSGPEGGLSAAEESQAQAAGFLPLTLGPRVLRAETAPLAALAYLQLHGGR